MIAERCASTAAGHLVGCQGGPDLVAAVGSVATLKRHTARLIEAGVLVVAIRGGAPGTFRGQHNTYAIPAAPGALDHIVPAIEPRRMVPCADGAWRPVPASTPTLFHPRDLTPLVAAPALAGLTPHDAAPDDAKTASPAAPAAALQGDTRSPESDTRSEPRCGPRSVPRFTPRLTSVPPTPPSRECDCKNSRESREVPRTENVRGKRPDAVHNVADAELFDLRSLLRRFARAASMGMLEGHGSDHDRLMFVAAAIYARERATQRDAGKRAAYFARIIRRGLYLFGEGYVERANDWIKRGTECPAVPASRTIDEPPIVSAATGTAGFSMARSLYGRAIQSGSAAMTAKRAVLAALRRQEPTMYWTMEKLEQEIG